MKQTIQSFYWWYIALKFGICLGFVILVAGQAGINCNVTVCAADYTDVFYIGEATGSVNVRVAAGTENDQVMHNGEKVILKLGDKVTIIGEDMADGKVWYKVYFILDGDEIIGYSSSSYVKKTGETIMPTSAPEGDRGATDSAVDYIGVVYNGVVEGDVNVRVAAGRENAQVMHNGEKVYLKAGDKVTIIGKDIAGGKVWYKVRFILDGDEIVGYSSGDYITKTERVDLPMDDITEKEPTTLPMDDITKTEPAPLPMDEKEEQKSVGGILGFLKSKWPWIVGAVVLFIIFGSGSSASTSSSKSTSSGASARTTICFHAEDIPGSNKFTAYIDGKKVCSFDGNSSTRDIDVTPGYHVIKFSVYNDASENFYWLGPFYENIEEGTEYDMYPGK